ncbi:TusE/DsrC/DsvC family sulfur relay protein [Desulfogranum marinum]|jgi:tRNA 2-thiouridine synthesizing protein E|uniref:TusE/DsrC/DsvC family sulfur relay protein n=1 Tax=Desulfogranum marinum TaxID=453220 RepID=UPI001966C8F6|nr:TusE/DsrC/DsvC family sulfur relay protein [Desulfogranum marinum]MBM9514129.1 TusE/DsrC/DsvC family sulfur relay protein [Desulfogranum marinum]
MGSVRYMGKDIALDSEGFLLAGEDWNEDIAKKIAAREGLDNLNKEQLEIITFMREYFFKYKVFPILNNVCKIVHQPKQCVNEQFLNPEIAWKIAGLPKQEGFHFISMDGKTYKMESCC